MKINTVLMIFLILITVSYAEQEPEGLGEAPEQSTEREAVESFQNNIETSYAQGKPFEGTAPGNAQINTRLGNINLPSGSQVSTSSAGIHAAKTDSAKTQLGTFSGCKDIYFFDTKEVQAQTCKYLQIASIQASDATEIFVTQTSTKFNTANHLQLQIPNSNDFWNIPNATDITIIFVGNNIQNVRMTLPDTPIILPNPLRLDAGRFQTVGDLNDADADGLSDSFEQINQLNSQNKDSDGDGLTDYEEVMLYPTSPKNAKTYEGTWQNDKEFAQQLRANPTMLKEVKELKILNILNDRDADGISDLNELKYKTDYENFDTDEDGYGDGYELTKGMNPLIPDGAGNKAMQTCIDCLLTITKGGLLIVNFQNYNGIKQESTIGITTNTTITITGNTHRTVFRHTQNSTKNMSTIDATKTTSQLDITSSNAIETITIPNTSSETVYGNHKKVFNYETGITLAELEENAAYHHTDISERKIDPIKIIDINYANEIIAKNFLIHRPTTPTYTLLFDKKEKRLTETQFNQQAQQSPNYGYVSFVTNTLILPGKITLSKEEAKKAFTGKEYLQSTLRIVHPIYESFVTNNNFRAEMENNWATANITLTLNAQPTGTRYYNLHYDDMMVYETSTGTTTERYAKFEHLGTPRTINRFSSNTHHDITQETKAWTVLKQKSNTSETTLYSISDASGDKAVRTMREYKKAGSFEECETWDTVYLDKEKEITLLAWIQALGFGLLFITFRKGQLTVAVILSFLVLFTVITLIYVYYLEAKANIHQTIEIQAGKIPINQYANQCYITGLRCAMYRLTSNGGGMTHPTALPIEESVKLAESYVSKTVPLCINAYRKHVERLEAGDPHVEIVPGTNTVNLKSKHPITVTAAKTTTILQDLFETTQSIRYEYFHKTMTETRKQQDIPLSILERKEGNYTIYETEPTNIYEFTDQKSIAYGGIPYKFWWTS